jgi:hypothetical protein
MTNENDFISYFEGLAIADPDLKHNQNGRKSFFCIDDPFDLDEIDNAVRDTLQMPCMLLDMPDGDLTENGTAGNPKDILSAGFMILLKGLTIADKRLARVEAKRIGKNIIKEMKANSRASLATPNMWHLNREAIKYQRVGPIADSYYGMMFTFTITCPF